MDTVRAVLDLLFEHDCVIVPGFGAFIGHYREAFHNTASQEFTPPSKKISFNRLLVQNDGLLATHYSLQIDQSYSSALLLLQEEAKQWTDLLETSGNLSLKGLGYFRCDKDGKWIFTAAVHENLNKSSFGLIPLNQRILDRKRAPVEQVSKAFLEETKPKVYAEARKRKGRGRSFIVTMSAFLIGMIGISQLLIFTDAPVNFKEAGMIRIYSTTISKHEGRSIKAHPYKAIPRSEQVLHSVHILTPIATGATEIKIVEPVKYRSEQPVTSSVDMGDKYAVIKGCFKERMNAEKVQSQLKAEGKQVYWHEMKNGIVQIGFYAGNDAGMAQQNFQQELKRQKDCYLKQL